MRGEIHGFDDLGHRVRIIAATGRPTGRRKSKFYDDRSGESGCGQSTAAVIMDTMDRRPSVLGQPGIIWAPCATTLHSVRFTAPGQTYLFTY